MQELVKFAAARIACTAASYVIYIALLYWMDYAPAYAIAYMAGIALSYLINALMVFKQPMTRRSAVLFPLIYIFQFFLGMLILRACIELFGVAEWLSMLFSIVLTFPMAYFLSKWAMRSTRKE